MHVFFVNKSCAPAQKRDKNCIELRDKNRLCKRALITPSLFVLFYFALFSFLFVCAAAYLTSRTDSGWYEQQSPTCASLSPRCFSCGRPPIYLLHLGAGTLLHGRCRVPATAHQSPGKQENGNQNTNTQEDKRENDDNVSPTFHR